MLARVRVCIYIKTKHNIIYRVIGRATIIGRLEKYIKKTVRHRDEKKIKITPLTFDRPGTQCSGLAMFGRRQRAFKSRDTIILFFFFLV